ncbi:hypothetical protein J6X15_03160, partial [Candidatus Saccharibacteria bacterium]|nr:hypothetical protein [Candidatus Saccharibacteria bacterium]
MNGDDYDDYTGHGIDQEQSAQDVMGVDLGNGLKSKIRNSEDNPRKPFDKGHSARGAGGVLSAGEQNQQSDKDTNSADGASWANRTGEKARMISSAASGNMARFAKDVKRKGGIKGASKALGPAATILIILALCIGAVLGSQSTMLGSLVGNLQRNFDPIDIAAAVRSKVLIKSIMSGKNAKGGLWSKFSDHMKAKFSQSGIEVVSDGDVENLQYKNSSDEEVKVTADSFDSEIRNGPEFNAKFEEGASTYNNGTMA